MTKNMPLGLLFALVLPAGAQMDAAEPQPRDAVIQPQAAPVRQAPPLRALLLEKLAAIAKITDAERGLVIDVPETFFARGRRTLSSEGRGKLAQIARVLKAQPLLVLRIEGAGNGALDRKFSEMRAAAVGTCLVEEGVSHRSIHVQGLEEGRRVSIVVTGKPIEAPRS